MEIREDLERFGLNEENYQSCLEDIFNKCSGVIDMDWSEIRDKYNINCNPDTIRKAATSIFGSYFVTQYLKTKNHTSTSQLDRARQLVGEQMLLKRQLQNERNEINKFKREFVKSISIAEELEQFMVDNNFTINVPEACFEPIVNDSNCEMIVHITDWHIGYVIHDCKGNKYNWEIANQRVDQLIQTVYRYIDLYNIKKIYVINTGDMIENIAMRKTQSQYCEFKQSEQINRAIEIIFRFLCALCERCEVEYDSVFGNHDRSNGDITANLDGDNSDVIIRRQITTYAKLANMTRLQVIQRAHTDKEIIKEVNGILLKARHGDVGVKDDKQKLKSDISMDEQFYDLLIEGHEHNFRCISENRGRYVVHSGCLSGFNDYSTGFGCATEASQTLIVVDSGKVELIKDVTLN